MLKQSVRKDFVEKALLRRKSLQTLCMYIVYHETLLLVKLRQAFQMQLHATHARAQE